MQLIFDNLLATFVFGAIVLMVASTQARNQRVRVKAQGAYALRSQQLSFISTLRLDMAGMICDDSNLTKCPDFEEDSSDNTYTFHTRLGGSSSTATVYKVTYKRRQVGTLDDEDNTKLYQIERYVDPSASLSDPDGGSMSTITSWSIKALNGAGQPPSAKGDIRKIKIRFETVPPFTEEGTETRPWEATYEPVHLREDNTV